ncbi:hypothetical protein MRB53_012038 [Persea americana]|uniref:Uncharacterized protein n=1 Tax=Persea americana TaxID=3435 RepID=A0ACC2LWN1_PERAE|nr:hypothetical protein MRB53_012038 [Persea americana]
MFAACIIPSVHLFKDIKFRSSDLMDSSDDHRCGVSNDLTISTRGNPSAAMATGRTRRSEKKGICNQIYAIIFFCSIAAAVAAEDDVRCLQGVRSSLADPQNKLESWNFSNSTVGFICRFVGATCWNEKENRLIDLRLPGMELSGEIPNSLQYCVSMNTLDLSNNALTGAIPAEICDWLPYLVTLDLSSNRLSGQIPPELFNCKFLNTLRLNDNELSGNIPYQLSRLNRLKKLSVANNHLSGSIPAFLSEFEPADFEGNDLCGSPLGSNCGGLRKTSLIIIIAAGVFGAAVSLLLGFALWWWCFFRSSRRRRKGRAAWTDGDISWAEKLGAYKLIQVTLFQKPIVKIKLADLMAATNNFDPDNIIFSSRTGTSYRAILADGSALAIKRLHTYTNGGSTLINGDFGDFGYIAPEYASTLVASLKGDVYGFGVVLLELATGQKPLEVNIGEEGFKGNLVEWVGQLSGAGRMKDAIDKSLCGRGHDDDILEFLRVACGCVVARPKDRPSMDQVYQSLRNLGMDYDFSEQFDELPVVFGKHGLDQLE